MLYSSSPYVYGCKSLNRNPASKFAFRSASRELSSQAHWA